MNTTGLPSMWRIPARNAVARAALGEKQTHGL